MSQPFTNQGGVLTNLTSNFGNILSTKPAAQFASGARTTVKVNGKPFAFANAVSWTINTINYEVRTIDDYLPWEIAPQMITVEGTISGCHVPGFSATADLIQANVLSFLFNKYITIEVRDHTTDTLLFYAPRAVVVSRTENINAEQLGQVNISFKSIGWQDELKPSYPNNYDGSQTNSTGQQGILNTIQNALQNPAAAIKSLL